MRGNKLTTPCTSAAPVGGRTGTAALLQLGDKAGAPALLGLGGRNGRRRRSNSTRAGTQIGPAEELLDVEEGKAVSHGPAALLQEGKKCGGVPWQGGRRLLRLLADPGSGTTGRAIPGAGAFPGGGRRGAGPSAAQERGGGEVAQGRGAASGRFRQVGGTPAQ